jgi:hypothetical protein
MRKAIGSAALIAVAVTGGLFLAQRDGDHTGEALHQVSSKDDSVPHGAKSSSSAAQNQGTSSISSILNSSKTKELALGELLPEAEKGSAQYILAVNEILSGCELLYMPAEQGIDRIVPAAVRSEEAWKRRYAERGKFCGNRTDLDARAEKLVANMQARMNVLASQGDRVAQMYDAMADAGGRLSASDAQIAVDILKDAAADSESVRRAAHALVSSDSESIRQVDSEIFGGAYSPEDRATIKSLAAQAYACSRGAYCGPSANFQMDNCLLTGACDVLVPFNEYVRKYSLSGADYKLMQLYVERIATFAGGSQ